MFRRITEGTKWFVAVVLLAVLPLIPYAQASAQAPSQTPNQGLSLTTSPLPITLMAKPGTTVSTDIRIKNSGNQSELLQVKLYKFYSNNSDGQPGLSDRAPSDTYFDWVSFSRSTFVAEPNVWETITMTIKVPPTAGLGYYYAVVFQRATPPGQTQSGASVAGGAATLVLLDVQSPNAKRELSITSFISTKRLYEFLPATFEVTLKNTGNIFLSPSGSVYITKDNKPLATIDMNPGHGNLLPNGTRTFTVVWNDGFPSYSNRLDNGATVLGKNGKPKQDLNWNLQNADKFRFGKFTANVLVVYDNGQRDIPIEATVSFWVIPWRIIAVILVIVALFLFLIIRYIQFARLRRRTKKAAKAEKHKKDHPPEPTPEPEEKP